MAYLPNIYYVGTLTNINKLGIFFIQSGSESNRFVED